MELNAYIIPVRTSPPIDRSEGLFVAAPIGSGKTMHLIAPPPGCLDGNELLSLNGLCSHPRIWYPQSKKDFHNQTEALELFERVLTDGYTIFSCAPPHLIMPDILVWDDDDSSTRFSRVLAREFNEKTKTHPSWVGPMLAQEYAAFSRFHASDDFQQRSHSRDTLWFQAVSQVIQHLVLRRTSVFTRQMTSSDL